jgi:hypothetical protein
VNIDKSLNLILPKQPDFQSGLKVVSRSKLIGLVLQVFICNTFNIVVKDRVKY